MPNRIRPRAALTLALLAVSAAPAADVILVPDSDADRVLAFDAADGSLLDPNFILDPGSVSGVDIFNRPIEAVASASGTVLVSDQFADLVAEFDFSGNFIRIFSNAGVRDTSLINNIRGLDVSGTGTVLVANSGPTTTLALSRDNILELAAADGALEPDFAFIRYGGVYGPFDVLTLADRILVANETRNNILRFAPDGSFVEVFASEALDFPQQITQLADGNFLVANFSAGNFLEYDPNGTLVGFEAPLNISLPRGVVELDNGNLLITSGGGSGGVFTLTRGGVNATQILAGADYRYCTRVTLPALLTTDDLRDENAIAREHARQRTRRVPAADLPHELVLADERGDIPAWQAPDNERHDGRIVPIDPPHRTHALRGEEPASDLKIYLIEDSGFFGASGIVNGTLGRTTPDDPATVEILGNAGAFFWGGLDFRLDDADEFFGFENLTNSLRRLVFGDGNTLIDSIGYFTSGASGFSFAPDGETFYAGTTSGSVFRIVQADSDTAQVLNTWWFLTPSTSLATVPPGTGLPYPTGQLWALYTQAIDTPLRQLRIVQYDLSGSGSILSDRAVSGLDFQAEFETGLDFAPDGTLYASVQGYRVLSIDPIIVEEESAHLVVIDPVNATATDLGQIQADMTWDVSGIAVLPPATQTGDLNDDGCVDVTDLAILLADFGCASGCAGDVDGNDTTDLSDLAALLANFGQGC